MENQDWKPVCLNPKKTKPSVPFKERQTFETKTEVPKMLGEQIAKARVTANETRKTFSAKLGVTQQQMALWETNKEVPTNAEIAKIEKLLGQKLPRTKKIKIKTDEQ